MLNNNQNGYMISTPDQANLLDSTGKPASFFFQNGVQTPGVFSIPVCAGCKFEAKSNWKRYGGVEFNPPSYHPPFYPCESPGTCYNDSRANDNFFVHTQSFEKSYHKR